MSELAAHSRRHTLSDAGAAFVAQVTDPFSDDAQRVVGMPDQTSGQSIVYDIRQELTIERPSTITADDTFDVHIAMMPLVSTNNVSGTTDDSVFVTWSAQTGQVSTVAAVNNWNCDGGVIAVNKVASGSLTFDPTDATSEYQFIEVPVLVDPTTRARPLSIAYEVINETEDLYKSGAITDYRIDADPVWTQFDIAGSGGIAPCGGWIGNLPPSTLAQAKQVNGVTRAATEGSLVVGCFEQRDIPANFPSDCQAVLLRSDSNLTIPANALSLRSALQYNSTTTSYVRKLPFMQSGSYASGLAGRSKLRLVAHILVEVFPRPGSELMPIATLAPSYDAMALELISELQSQTLPGYPVSWNGLGKYTKKLVDAVRKYTSPVLKMAAEVARESGRPGAAQVLSAAAQATKKKKR